MIGSLLGGQIDLGFHSKMIFFCSLSEPLQFQVCHNREYKVLRLCLYGFGRRFGKARVALQVHYKILPQLPFATLHIFYRRKPTACQSVMFSFWKSGFSKFKIIENLNVENDKFIGLNCRHKLRDVLRTKTVFKTAVQKIKGKLFWELLNK
jgi:hypothetical protein